ncbi:hypothetical protein HKD37_20G057818 [Glycine soja]
MQRKFHFLVNKDKATSSFSADDNSDNGGTRFTCGTQFTRKTFSCVIGNKATPRGKRASKLKKKKEPLGQSGNGKAALSQLLALEETDCAGEAKQNRKDRQRVKMNLPLLSFPKNMRGWNNLMRARFGSEVHGDGNNVVTKFGQVRRKASLRYLVRLPSKILVLRLKLKMIKCLVKKKPPKQFKQGAEDDDENEDREPCKKRILLGERCRPFSSPSPGYDTSNFFLPRVSYLTRAQRHP